MRKVLQQLLLIPVLSVLVISCEKDEEPFPPVKSEEKTIIQLPEAEDGPLKTLALDLPPGVATIDLVEIRRDAANAAELNKTLAVKIKNQNALISEPSSGEINELPRNIYTSHPDNPFDGQYWTVTFKPGEFVKFLKINLDPSALVSLSMRVGLGLLIAEAPGALISASKNQIGVEISSKNQWDGIYRLDAYTEHPTNPVLTGVVGPYEMPLITIGSDKVIWQFTHPWANGSNSTTPAGYNPVFTIDPTTNSVAVTDISGIGFENDPSYPNPRYDPAAKKFYVKWRYNAAGGFRLFTDTLTYLRPR